MHITACRYAVQCQPCFTPAYFTLSTSACHISPHMAPAQMSPCFASQNHLTQTYNLQCIHIICRSHPASKKPASSCTTAPLAHCHFPEHSCIHTPCVAAKHHPKTSLIRNCPAVITMLHTLCCWAKHTQAAASLIDFPDAESLPCTASFRA